MRRKFGFFRGKRKIAFGKLLTPLRSGNKNEERVDNSRKPHNYF